jgi:tRNA pseudouridine55 synthase
VPIIIVDKPKGWTSNDVVQKIKHHFKYKKVGHAGTLDPNATGILIIGCNESTKDLGKLILDNKEYEAEIQFGIQTDSYDVCGRTLKTCECSHITIDEIIKILNVLKNNDYWQTPPIFSAKKINGTPMYKIARQNHKIININPVKVKLYDFQIINFKESILKLKIFVSKGFYVRSLANDLGIRLNSCATLINLRRTKSGNFDIKDAMPLNQLIKDN